MLTGKEWSRIKLMYETSSITLSALGEQFNTDPSNIGKRAKKEGWQRCKENHSHGFIYIIQAEGDPGYYKIGISCDIETRLKKLQPGNWRKLKLIYHDITKNVSDVERSIHERFKTKRLASEWFKLTDEEVEKIKEWI